MFDWLYDNIVAPVGNFFSDAGNWIYDNVIDPVVSWTGDILTGGQQSANRTNQNIANQNIAFQEQANAQNIAFQQQENEITRQREDNAVQRAAADMQAAGLSKTLAAGSPASAASLVAPHVEAKHNDYKAEKLNYLGGMLELAQRSANLQTTQINNSLAYDQYLTEKKYKESLIRMNDSQSALNASNRYLVDLKGENYVRELDASINKILSETSLNWSKVLTDGEYRELLKQETMTELKKQTWYDNEADVQTWNYLSKYMDYLIDEYNLGLYQGINMPTNMNSGLSGLASQAAMTSNNVSNSGGLINTIVGGILDILGIRL